MMELLDFFSFRIAIATLTPVTTIQTFSRGRLPRSPLTQQRRQQNGSLPLNSTAFTTLIISLEWLLKVGSARQGHSANLTFLPRHPEPSATTGKKWDRLLKPCLNSLPLESPPGSTSKSCSGALVYKQPRV